MRGDMEKLKGFLNSIRKQQADYLSLREELRRLEFETHNIQGVKMGEKVQNGHCADLGETVEKLEDYYEKVIKAYSVLVELRAKGEELISKEEDGVRRAVLRRRYIQCERWGDIAEKCISLSRISTKSMGKHWQTWSRFSGSPISDEHENSRL